MNLQQLVLHSTGTGPSGFESNEEDPFVTETGLYVVTVTGLNGCEASAEAIVIAGDPDDCEPDTKIKIGDKVWDDTNQNGIQDEGENGMPNVLVVLHYCDSTIVDSMITDSIGCYIFEDVADSSYFLTFELPSGYTFTLADNPSGGDSLDSDVVFLYGQYRIHRMF